VKLGYALIAAVIIVALVASVSAHVSADLTGLFGIIAGLVLVALLIFFPNVRPERRDIRCNTHK